MPVQSETSLENLLQRIRALAFLIRECADSSRRLSISSDGKMVDAGGVRTTSTLMRRRACEFRKARCGSQHAKCNFGTIWHGKNHAGHSLHASAGKQAGLRDGSTGFSHASRHKSGAKSRAAQMIDQSRRNTHAAKRNPPRRRNERQWPHESDRVAAIRGPCVVISFSSSPAPV